MSGIICFLMTSCHAAVAELVDARDLKSRGSDIVWVRFPPAAQELFCAK